MRSFLLFGSIVFGFIHPAFATESGTRGVPLLVSTEWLAERLHDLEIVVLWTGSSRSGSSLIPGTRRVPHGSVMTMAHGHGLDPMEDLVETLERAGVSDDSHVIVYGQPMSAGWLFFVLDHLGHQRVSMLDGGLDKWREERRPLAAVERSPVRGSFTAAIRPEATVTANDVLANLGTGAVTLLDARSSREYEAGRIPGAELVSWQSVYADPERQTFKSRDELKAMFADAGVMPGEAAITYCQIGMRASVLYFAARYAGLNVSNYVGSWRDWTARGLPTD